MKDKPVTYILIALNIGVFLWMAVTGTDVFSPNPEDLFKWGGMTSEALMASQWWRLLTCTFIHSGILHLLMNLYSLFYIGRLLEPVLGRSRYLLAYVSSGILASLTSGLYHIDSYAVCIGASGAIFGLFGVFLALISTKIFFEEIRRALFVSIAPSVAMNIFYSFQEGVDFAAHLGGLAAGFIVGYCLCPSLLDSKKIVRYASYASIPLFALGVLATSFQLMKKRDAYTFYSLRQQLFSNLDKLEMAQKSPAYTEDVQVTFERVIFPLINEQNEISSQMKDLVLSGDKEKHRNTIVEYIQEQFEKYERIAQLIKENTDNSKQSDIDLSH